MAAATFLSHVLIGDRIRFGQAWTLSGQGLAGRQCRQLECEPADAPVEAAAMDWKRAWHACGVDPA